MSKLVGYENFHNNHFFSLSINGISLGSGYDKLVQVEDVIILDEPAKVIRVTLIDNGCHIASVALSNIHTIYGLPSNSDIWIEYKGDRYYD